MNTESPSPNSGDILRSNPEGHPKKIFEKIFIKWIKENSLEMYLMIFLQNKLLISTILFRRSYEKINGFIGGIDVSS